MQDIIIWFARKKSKDKKRFTYSLAWTKLRYAILAIMALSFVTGFVLLLAIFDPYSIYGRSVTHLLSPLWMSVNNLLARVSDKYEWYFITKQTIYLQSIEALLLSMLSLFVIGFIALKYGRLYCNTICPVGTMLGMLSRFSLCKITVDTNKCNHCSRCAAKCKSSCIDSKTQEIDYSRCINCFDCIGICQQKALSFTIPSLRKQGEKNTEVSIGAVSRRRFLTTSALAMAGAVIATASPSTESVDVDEHLSVLPPGSKSHTHLSTHCTSCHLCVSKCPNQVLKPMSLEYGIATVMQPAMDFKKGYCDYGCNLCGIVCPNHAIKQLSLEQKQNIKIGYAIFDQSRCVVKTDDVNCGNCAIHCPTMAITMVDYKDKKIPSIDLSRCIGCGSCEYHCPACPGAIRVVGFAEHK